MAEIAFKKDYRLSKKKPYGFTLIELLIAIFIFSIISSISYKVISSLILSKQIITEAQNKWGSITKTINRISQAWRTSIPLTIRDQDGLMRPVVLGKNKLENRYDSQLELTVSGYVGDEVYGVSPPRRIGFRFVGGSIYLVTWPVLNRVVTTLPRMDLLVSNVADFKITYLYPDNQWRDTWPLDNIHYFLPPRGIKIYFKSKSGEEITRILSL